ncbi:MAG: DNA repair protein RadC [Cellvibrionaceae bacterium]|jgi:DNA repair protein RadC
MQGITSKPVEPQNEYVPMIRDMPLAERPRERLERVGSSAVSTSELLAIILRTGSSGEHVVRLAERILFHFGDLRKIEQATIAELCQVKGIGPAKAVEIKAAIELGRRAKLAGVPDKPRITTPADAANLVMSEMGILEQEHLRVMLLDTRNNVLKLATIYIGSLNAAVVRVGEVFRAAIRENAAAIIVIHNHPSGDPSPSNEDVKVTAEIVKAGKLLDIQVLDHLVIGNNKFVSMRERGLGFEE